MLVMEILFIVPYVPNLVRVRPYQLIRALHERGHRLTLLTLTTSQEDYADINHLQQFCTAVHALPMPAWHSLWNCLKMLPGRDPLQSVYSWHPSLIAPYLHISYDVVHVEHLRGARYALAFKQHTHLPVVWDSVDSITHLFTQAAEQSRDQLRRWRSKFELSRTRRYESWLVRQFDQVLVTSTTDREMLQVLGGSGAAPITVLPNGVDLNYFRPDTAVARSEDTLIVTGKMSYHANISMVLYLARQIMPLVWQQKPNTRLLIVGKDPTSEIRQLAQHANVTVTGAVNHLPPYLQQATIAVAPILYNAGIQNKVLEAMACGTPVITTPQAVSTLPLQPGRDVIVAEDAEAFAQQIVALMGNPERRHQLGVNGRCYVETHHRWADAGKRLEEIYGRAIQAKASTSRVYPAPSLAETR